MNSKAVKFSLWSRNLIQTNYIEHHGMGLNVYFFMNSEEGCELCEV